MEAICRKILGKGKNIVPKAARWGLQRQFPTQRRRQARNTFRRNLNTNTLRRPQLLTKKQFAPIRSRNNRNNNYSTISSFNNNNEGLPASPVGSINSRYTANTQNTVNAPWPPRGGRRTRRLRR